MFNKNIRTSFTTLISVSLLVLFSKTAFAAPIHQPDLFEPNNNLFWKMEFYFDKSPTHFLIPAEVKICFSEPIRNEMHQEYAWISPNGNGYASQEGDQVFMHGNLYKLDFGAELEITSQDEASGHLRIWVPNQYHPYWHVNTTLTRMKEKCETPEPPKPSS